MNEVWRLLAYRTFYGVRRRTCCERCGCGRWRFWLAASWCRFRAARARRGSLWLSPEKPLFGFPVGVSVEKLVGGVSLLYRI
ncbi:hypothetical protein Hanom_Chr01g00040531 [Helianthus anomalus]